MPSNQENFTYSVSVQADVAMAMAALRRVQVALIGVGAEGRAAQFGFGKMAMSLMAVYTAARLTAGMFEKFTRQMALLQTQFQRLQSMGFNAQTMRGMASTALATSTSGTSVMTAAQVMSIQGRANLLTGGEGATRRAVHEASMLTRLTGDPAAGRSLAAQIQDTALGFAIAGPPGAIKGTTARMQKELFGVAKGLGDPQLFQEFIQALNGFSTTMKENLSNRALDKLAAMTMLTKNPEQLAGVLNSMQTTLESPAARQGALLMPLMHLAGIANIKAIAAGRPFAASGMTLEKYLSDPLGFLSTELVPKLAQQEKTGKLSDIILRRNVMGAFHDANLADFIIQMVHLQASGALSSETGRIATAKGRHPQQTIASAMTQFSTAWSNMLQHLSAPGLIKGINALTGLLNDLTNVEAKHPAVGTGLFYGGLGVAGFATWKFMKSLFGGAGKFFGRGAGKVASGAEGAAEGDFGHILGTVEKGVGKRLGGDGFFISSQMMQGMGSLQHFFATHPHATSAQINEAVSHAADVATAPNVTVKVYLDGKEVSNHIAKRVITATSNIPQSSSHITASLP